MLCTAFGHPGEEIDVQYCSCLSATVVRCDGTRKVSEAYIELPTTPLEEPKPTIKFIYYLTWSISTRFQQMEPLIREDIDETNVQQDICSSILAPR
jgi:hypothetical protein